MVMFKVSGLVSRFRSGLPRAIYLLYKKARGEQFELTDTLCSCDGGLRTVGGCAHSIAVLRYVHETQQQIEEPLPSRSLRIYNEMFPDCLSEDEFSDSGADDE